MQVHKKCFLKKRIECTCIVKIGKQRIKFAEFCPQRISNFLLFFGGVGTGVGEINFKDLYLGTIYALKIKQFNIYLYIHIHMCVCVCVCSYLFDIYLNFYFTSKFQFVLASVCTCMQLLKIKLLFKCNKMFFMEFYFQYKNVFIF